MGAFNLTEAIRCVKASQAVYPGGHPELLFPDNKIQAFGFDPCVGFAVELEDRTLVSYCGTDSLRDALADVDVFLISNKNYPGLVHKGFSDGLDAVWPQMISLIRKDKPVQTTGHSLGASHSQLGQTRLKNEGYILLDCYSFATPKTGNVDFKLSFASLGLTNYKVMREGDVIPLLPWLPKFRMSGISTYLDGYGKLNSNLDEFLDMLDVLYEIIKKQGVPSLFVPEFITKHSVDGYMGDLLSNQAG